MLIVVLLYCENLLAQNNQISSTGERDSICFTVDEIREVNAKLIEAKYIKEENDKLNQIVANDDKIIANYTSLTTDLTNKYNKIKAERNIVTGSTIVLLIAFIIALCV